MTPAIFVDKDGTLIEDVPYNADPARIVLTTGAAAGVQRLAAVGFRIVVVTNQSGVARGYFPHSALDAVEDRLTELLAVPLSFYACPHWPEGVVPEFATECLCRKPLPGLLHQAARDLDIDLGRSWMLGDILNDVEAGRRAGCRTILIDNGNETEWEEAPLRTPHFWVADVAEAAAIILARMRLAA